MSSSVKVLAPPEQDEVGLGFRVLVEPDRALNTDDIPLALGSPQQLVQPHDASVVAAADGRHLDYLSFDELDPVVLVEDAGLGHAVVVMDGEMPPDDLGHKPSGTLAL
jgi:hypothetical protein